MPKTNTMKPIFSNWSIPRILQLLVGGYLIWNYIEDKMIFSLIFGAVMLYQAIMNVGCFSTKGCAVNYDDTSKNNDDVV